MKAVKMLLISLVVWSSAATAGGLTVQGPWIREAPPTAQALAGYMVIKNDTDQERALVGASSPAFGHVMLHKTIMEDGMAKMIHQPKVVVPAGGAVSFEPKGLHLMLMGPKSALKAGDKVEVTLEFEDGSSMPLLYEVRGGAAMPMDAGHHGMMH